MKKNFSHTPIGGKRFSTLRRSLLRSAGSFLMAVIFTVVIFPSAHAQTVLSLASQLKSLDVTNAQHLQSLVSGLHPSVYLTGGIQKTYGPGAPVVAICDAASVNLLYSVDPAFSQVELIRITINSSGELPPAIDLTRMTGFTNLQYLLVVFAYDACGEKTDGCLATKVDELVQGTGSPIVTLFKLSIPQ